MNSTIRRLDRTSAEILGEEVSIDLSIMLGGLKKVAPFPDIYGLHVLGADFSVPISTQFPSLSGELYYDGAQPGTSTTYITCSNDRIDKALVPSMLTGDEALCEEFEVPELDAVEWLPHS